MTTEINRQDRWELRQLHGQLLEQAKNIAAILEDRRITKINKRELQQALEGIAQRIERFPITPEPPIREAPRQPLFNRGDLVHSCKAGVTKKVWGSRWDGAENVYTLEDEKGLDTGYLEEELDLVHREVG